MTITTKTGDGGQTSLYSGERVWKDDLRVHAYGALDELDAHLGDARHLISAPQALAILADIQNMLYRVMGELADTSGNYPHPIIQADVEAIETLIKTLETATPVEGFVIPGGLCPPPPGWIFAAPSPAAPNVRWLLWPGRNRLISRCGSM